MSQLYPEVKDVSTLTSIFRQDQFLQIGVEGQKDAGGTGVVGTPYLITRASDADTYFGPNSSLSGLVKFLLNRGVNFVTAVASASAVTPTLVQRQTAWQTLEESRAIRIRLTDSMLQADLVALADSCEWAEAIQHRQFAVMGLPTPTTSAALTAAAAAIASKRGVLVGPGIYDAAGTLLAGNYAAAAQAAEVAKNPDIADDLDRALIPGFTAIEKAVNGMPLFRIKAGAGTPVNDFETLLQAGVSPFRQSPNGGVENVHLRTTWTADTSHDALMTLLIRDEVFERIRDALEGGGFLRMPNDDTERGRAAAVVRAELQALAPLIQPVLLPDGTTGYGVNVVASADQKKMTIHYNGEIVRGTQVIELNGSLTIAA